MDDELRVLEVKAREVGDTDTLVRYGKALGRAGERKKAAGVLARAVEKDPGSRAAILALDEVAPLGLDPTSPSPGLLGSHQRAPSTVEGPDELTVRRVPLSSTVHNLDITDSEGWLLALDEVPTRGTSRLVRVALDGTIEVVKESEESPSTVCEGFFLSGSRVLWRNGDPVPGERIRGAWTCGPGHVIHCPSESYVSAVSFGSPEDRWRLDGLDFVQRLAMLRNGIVLAHDRQGLHAIDLATGEHRDFLALEGNDPGPMIVSQDGRVFVMRWLPPSMGPSRSMIVCHGDRHELWRTAFEGSPVTLAGRGESVLICETTARPHQLVAFSARDGRELWSVPVPGWHAPRLLVDARGRIYSLRDGLGEQVMFVAIDPETGRDEASVELGTDVWTSPVLVAPKTVAIIASAAPDEPEDETEIDEVTRSSDLIIIGPGGAPRAPGA